jgi:integrase
VKLRRRNRTDHTLALKRTLDTGPIGKLSCNARLDGLPFKKESLENAFTDACVAAGILNKSAHGLRKAAATRAAESGATAHELMAIFGWIDIKEAEICTRAADRKRLATQSTTKDVCNFNTLFRWVKTLGAVSAMGAFRAGAAPRIGALE